MKNNKVSFTVLFLVMSVFSISYIHDAHACSCAAPTDYVTALAESEYAFTGTVTHIDNSLGPQKIHFDVTSVVKGDIPENKFVLENTNIINNDESSLRSSCDVGYQVGVTYNVFVYDNEFMNNGMCSTKAVGFLGIMNPFQYNLFHITILGLSIIAIATTVVFIIRRKKICKS